MIDTCVGLFHTEQKLQDFKKTASQQQYKNELVSSAIDIGRLLEVNYYHHDALVLYSVHAVT